MTITAINPQILFLGGYLCSGKGTYIERILSPVGYETITVSSIVKQIVGLSTRKELQDTAHLDKQIIDRIVGILEANPHQKFVIDGIRQPSIFWKLQGRLSTDIVYRLIWLEVSKDECKRRFEAKNDGKENISFEEAFDRDASLGLLELENIWKTKFHCQVIKNY